MTSANSHFSPTTRISRRKLKSYTYRPGWLIAGFSDWYNYSCWTWCGRTRNDETCFTTNLSQWSLFVESSFPVHRPSRVGCNDTMAITCTALTWKLYIHICIHSVESCFDVTTYHLPTTACNTYHSLILKFAISSQLVFFVFFSGYSWLLRKPHKLSV